MNGGNFETTAAKDRKNAKQKRRLDKIAKRLERKRLKREGKISGGYVAEAEYPPEIESMNLQLRMEHFAKRRK